MTLEKQRQAVDRHLGLNHDLLDAKQHIHHLTKRLAEAEKNSERYEKLKNNCYHTHVQVMQLDGTMHYVYGDELDKALEIVPTTIGEK